MLNDEEKREMLEDGLSAKRREDFQAEHQLQNQCPPQSLDEYIQFLKFVQKFYPVKRISLQEKLKQVSLPFSFKL